MFSFFLLPSTRSGDFSCEHVLGIFLCNLEHFFFTFSVDRTCCCGPSWGSKCVLPVIPLQCGAASPEFQLSSMHRPHRRIPVAWLGLECPLALDPSVQLVFLIMCWLMLINLRLLEIAFCFCVCSASFSCRTVWETGLCWCCFNSAADIAVTGMSRSTKR